jgi:predicted DNA-binding transcriptional regulator AlpA
MTGTLTLECDETVPEDALVVSYWDGCQQQRMTSSHDPQKDLVGLTEIAEMLGVTRQRAAQLAKRDDFPEPFGVTSAGTFWLRRQVQTYDNLRQERVERYTGFPKRHGSKRLPASAAGSSSAAPGARR